MHDFVNTFVKKPKGKGQWARYSEITDKQWKTNHYRPFLISKDRKLQWFQYRINCHSLTTYSLMYKILQIQINACTFCKTEKKQFII